jgi:hypothetical protein
VFDSEKTVVDRWENGEPVLNLGMMDFAAYYGFENHIAPRADGAYKGGVERPFWTVEQNFFNGRRSSGVSSTATTAEGDSHWLDRFGRLLEAQRRARRERAIERRIDEARESLLVAGMSGTGKSHIAIALGHLACVEGYRVRYTTRADMLTVLHLALATQDLQQATKPFVRCELLIIDEVGLDKPERQAYKTHDASLFYKVVAARYQAGRSCVITTNIKWDNWGEYLGDEVATAAILDRLVHHSHAISIDGPSWRVHQHAQLNRDEGNVGD